MRRLTGLILGLCACLGAEAAFVRKSGWQQHGIESLFPAMRWTIRSS